MDFNVHRFLPHSNDSGSILAYRAFVVSETMKGLRRAPIEDLTDQSDSIIRRPGFGDFRCHPRNEQVVRELDGETV